MKKIRILEMISANIVKNEKKVKSSGKRKQFKDGKHVLYFIYIP